MILHKKVTAWTCLSAGLLVALGTAWLWFAGASEEKVPEEVQVGDPGMAAPREEVQREAVAADEPQPEPVASSLQGLSLNEMVAAFRWKDFSLGDLRELVALLENTGVPAPTIRKMVETILEERVRRDPRAFVVDYPIAEDLPWHPWRDSSVLAGQRRDIMRDLFGSWDYGWTEADYERHRSRYGTISVDRARSLRHIRSYYLHQAFAAEYRDPNAPEVALWRVAALDTLAAVLTPEEMIQIELNQTHHGLRLRNTLANRDFSDEELGRLLEMERRRYLAEYGATLPEEDGTEASILMEEREILGDEELVAKLRATRVHFEPFIEQVLGAEARDDPGRQLDLWLAREAITDELKRLRVQYPHEPDYRQAVREKDLPGMARRLLVEAGGEQAWRRYQLSGSAGWLWMLEGDAQREPEG